MIFLYADLYFLSGCWFEVKKTSFITIWTTLWTNKSMNQQMNSSGLFSDSLMIITVQFKKGLYFWSKHVFLCVYLFILG